MFSTQNQAFKIAERVAAQQRAKEIAMKGHSNIELRNNCRPVARKKNSSITSRSSSTDSTAKSASLSAPFSPTSKKHSKPLESHLHRNSDTSVSNRDHSSSSVADSDSLPSSSQSTTAHRPSASTALDFKGRQAEAIAKAEARIADAMDTQTNKKERIEDAIRHHTEMAKARLQYSSNSMGALLSMQAVKSLQQDRQNIVHLMNGLHQIEENLRLGYVDAFDLSSMDKAIEEVVNAGAASPAGSRRSSNNSRRSFKDEDLLRELTEALEKEKRMSASSASLMIPQA